VHADWPMKHRRASSQGISWPGFWRPMTDVLKVSFYAEATTDDEASGASFKLACPSDEIRIICTAGLPPHESP